MIGRAKRAVALLPGLLAVAAVAQDSTRTHSIALRGRFSQIADGYNHGLVFSGIDLGADYRLARTDERDRWGYETRFVAGIMHDKRGGLALHFQFRPLDAAYAWRLGPGDQAPLLGPYGAVNYAWQVYPQLQSGHMFWYSSFELGPRLFARTSIGGRHLEVRASASLFGWASRPAFTTEEYFYSLRFEDYVKNPHRNLLFGGAPVFQHFDAELGLTPGHGKRVSLAYAFEYWSRSLFPRLRSLSHAINLRWMLGRKPWS